VIRPVEVKFHRQSPIQLWNSKLMAMSARATIEDMSIEQQSALFNGAFKLGFVHIALAYLSFPSADFIRDARVRYR